MPLYTTATAPTNGTDKTTMSTNQGSSLISAVNLKSMTETLTKKEILDTKVDRALDTLADGLLDDVIDFACRLAKHRGSNSLHRNDVRLAFEKRLKVRVPTRTQPPTSSSGPPQHSSAAASMGSAAGANLPVVVQAQPVSTANYKSNLALVKKAQEHYLNQQQSQQH